MLAPSVYFHTLSVAAVGLLWGVSLWNGTVFELVKATWHGRFEDGTPLKNNYTGIFPVDFVLTLLVSFFYYGTSNSDRGYQLFVLDAYSALQPAFVWLYIESNRNEFKPLGVNLPAIWASLWQGFGAAISLPLFYAKHLSWLDKLRQPLRSSSLSSARALPFSFVVGAVFPAVIGMLPTWTSRTALSHQNILAAWQADPLWVALTQASVASVFHWLEPQAERDVRRTVWWTRAACLLAAFLSAAGHLYVVYEVLANKDHLTNFERMYVPHLFRGPIASTTRLANGPWLFLQYDLIIIGLSSLSWAYFLLSRLATDTIRAKVVLVFVLMLGDATIGPGATVSLTLWWREGKLQHLRTNAELPNGVVDIKGFSN